LTDLCSYDDVHELLKMAVIDIETVVDSLWRDKQEGELSWSEIRNPFCSELERCGHSAALAGSQYATWFDPELWKEAFDFGWDFRGDIQKMSAGLGIPVTKQNLSTLHRALTGGEPVPTHELEQTLGYEKAKAVGRTVMLNIYNKAALRRWAKDGLLRVRRMEMRDRKTCPICRALHGQEYLIQDLLARQYPLTEDSHPNCRGTFVPILDTAVYEPEKREVPTGMDFEVGGSTAENVPLEVKPWLYSFLKSTPLPMNVRFDEGLTEAYNWEGFDVAINPSAIRQEDPREIILHAVADQVWDTVKDEFDKSYIPLIMDGEAAPAKSWTNKKELFVNNYIAYRMGQDQFPRSIAWFTEHIG
jgi:SPP1 gp7 family putative phage head morphogenesis protein